MKSRSKLPSQSQVSSVYLWQLCKSLLKEKSVKYRTLLEGMLPQAPSGRLRPGAFVFPGSKSPLNHVLFLSPLDNHRVMVTGYSKNLVFPGSEINELEVTAGKLNEANPVGLWKVERKNGNCFPVLEVIVGPVGWGSGLSEGREERAKELLWRCCGKIDVLFKTSGGSFTEANSMEAKDIALRVKEFLEKTGFKEIKESTIPRGVSYLVVLSNDDEDETSLWKRFPMKIDVAELITFCIFFPFSYSVVSTTKDFILLTAQVNPQFPVGFYNDSSGTRQLQYTLKLNYQSLSPADLRTSLKAYYDSAISCYTLKAREFVALYNRKNAKLDIEQPRGERNEDISWKQLEVNSPDPKLQDFLKKMETSSILVDHTLSRPFYRLSERGKVTVKTTCSHLPLCRFLEGFNFSGEELCLMVSELLIKLLEVGVFPTIDMLFCAKTSPLHITIIPDVGLHEDSKQCVSEFQQFLSSFLSSPTLKKILREVNKFAFNLNLSGDSKLNNKLGFIMMEDPRGSEMLLLYKMKKNTPESLRFKLLLVIYTLKLSKLSGYANKIVGIKETCYSEIIESGCLDSGKIYYLCERYLFQFYRFDDFFPSMLSFLEELKALHSLGYFHWFICPSTFRKEGGRCPQRSRKQLVLPCLTPLFAEVVYDCLEQSCKEFLAPEVKDYLQTGKQVADPHAADVYSFCKCILLKRCNIDKSTIQAATGEANAWDTLQRGTDTKPENRPTLGDVKTAIMTLWERQKRTKNEGPEKRTK